MGATYPVGPVHFPTFMKSIRIGAGLGFYGDNWEPVVASIERGGVQFIASDHLAELTLAILQKDRQRDPSLAAFTAKGWPARIAVVTGDDVLPRLQDASATADELAHLFTGEAVSQVRERLVFGNAYLGAAGAAHPVEGRGRRFRPPVPLAGLERSGLHLRLQRPAQHQRTAGHLAHADSARAGGAGCAGRTAGGNAMSTVCIPLAHIAHARSGDKADWVDFGLFAWNLALKFVLRGALQGGGARNLRLEIAVTETELAETLSAPQVGWRGDVPPANPLEGMK